MRPSTDALAPWVSVYSAVVPYLSRGRTREGADCWGLVRLVLGEQFGLWLPDYLSEYAEASARAEVSRAITARVDEWVRVRPLDRARFPEDERAARRLRVSREITEDPRPGDLVLAWQKSRSDWSHVGVYAGERQVLHTHPATDAAILQPVDDADYWGPRIVGYFRRPEFLPRDPDAVLPPEGLDLGGPFVVPARGVLGLDDPDDGLPRVTVAFRPSVVETPIVARVLAGRSVRDVVRELGILGDAAGFISITLNDVPLRERDSDGRDLWKRIRPKPGTYLAITPVPGFPIIPFLILALSQVAAGAAAAAGAIGAAAVGFGAGALGAVGLTGASASLTIGAGFGAASLGLGAGATAFGVGSVLGAAAIKIGITVGIGQLLKSVAAPSGSNPKTPTGPGSTRHGGNIANEQRPYSPVPIGFGKSRITPQLAARPYYEFAGEKRYLRAIYLIGQGRYRISDVRMNDVSLDEIAEDYEDGEVEYHTIEGGVPSGGYVGEVTNDVIGNAARHYWRLSEAGGTSADTGTIGGNTLLRSACSQVAGLITNDGNQGTGLNGTSSRLESSAAPITASGATPWTCELWIKPETGMATGSEVCLWCNGDTTSGWSIYLFGRTGEEPRRFRVKLFGAGGAATLDFGDFASITPGVADPRYHIALRWNGTKLHAFVNGGKRGKTLPAGVSFSVPSAKFSIGAERAGAGTFSKFFKGAVDEAATYNKALDDGQLYWRLDQGMDLSVTRGGNPRFFVDTVHEASLGGSPIFTTPNSDQVPNGTGSIDPPYPGVLLPAWQTVQIPGQIDEIEFNWEWPNGRYRLSENGAGRNWEVRLQSQYRRTDIANDEWVTFHDHDYVNQRVRHAQSEGKAIQVGRGEYEFRYRIRWDRYSNPGGDPDAGDLMGEGPGARSDPGAGAFPKRYTGSNETSVAMSDIRAVSIRGFVRDQKPVQLDGASLVAVKIPASASGTLTCVYERLLPVWNGSAFVEQPTRLAAWAALDVLRGSQGTNPRPILDTRIKLQDFVDWASRTWLDNATSPPTVRTDDVDLYVDYQSDTFSLFQQIAGLAFASLDFPDGQFGVVEDRAQTTPSGLITARNSKGFTGRIFTHKNPHALLTRYINADGHENELVVYEDGFSVDGSLDLEG
ncbi:MAG: NlpC/P60 family protein, partial [Actinobacteria bacterium]|nr:NlpC/P60 family protein [Actinomycetota bacterium]